jgi:hypothetical protein
MFERIRTLGLEKLKKRAGSKSKVQKQFTRAWTLPGPLLQVLGTH